MELIDFIKKSNLDEETKGLLVSIVSHLGKTQKEILEKFVDGKEENLTVLSQNLREKVSAFQSNDKKMLEKILKEESEQ